MKTPSVALLNSLGFTTSNYAQLAAYCWYLLRASNTNIPAKAAVTAKAAVIAQPAHPAYAARPAITAAQNTAGYTFGQLYLNSPAYAAGVAVPAIGAKPATAAVTAVPAVVAQAATKESVARPGLQNACRLNELDGYELIANIPYDRSYELTGNNFEDKHLLELSPTLAPPTVWNGIKAATTPGNLVAANLKPTVEALFYECAMKCQQNNPDSVSIKDVVFGALSIPCKEIKIRIGTTVPVDNVFRLNIFKYLADPSALVSTLETYSDSPNQIEGLPTGQFLANNENNYFATVQAMAASPLKTATLEMINYVRSQPTYIGQPGIAINAVGAISLPGTYIGSGVNIQNIMNDVSFVSGGETVTYRIVTDQYAP
jgi:hypothetical protein